MKKVLILILGIFWALSCSTDEPAPRYEPVKGNLEYGKTISLGNFDFYQGRTIKIGSAGTELSLENLELKQNTEGNRTSKVSIVAKEITGHTFGGSINPVSHLISVSVSGEKENEDGLYLLKIPLKSTLSKDEFAMAFYYNENTGLLEGIPMIAAEATSITIATRHFSSLFVSAIKKTHLPDNLETGFKPERDGWSFVNYGTAYNPGGICGGMSLTAMFAYLNKGGNLVQTADNEGLDFKTPEFWQDDSYGIIYSDFGQDEYSRIFRSWKSDLWLKGISDEMTYRSFTYSMMVTGEPQLVRIDKDGGAHAMVVYAIREKQLMVYDPNYPKNAERIINFKSSTTGTFEPYNSAQNAAEIEAGRGMSFPYITYAAKTAVADWSMLEKGWVAYKGKTLYQNDFGIKDLLMHIYDKKDSLIARVSEKGSVTYEEIRIRYSQPNFSNLGARVYDIDGKTVNAQSIKLKKGDNYLGLYLTKPASDGSWFGFKWFNIRYSELDENLIGRWEYKDSSGDLTYWHFKADGTAIQYINKTEYKWEWIIENGQLKLFEGNGKPAYIIYKIVGNELYFWVESMQIWGLPFKKAS